MNCENYLKLIDDLIEGELEEKNADEVSLHIFDCPNCTSQFEILEREKEIYSHYLFDIEPPKDLAAKFQRKLAAEEKPIILAAKSSFLSNIFAFLRLNPTLSTAVLLIACLIGFVVINLKTNEQPIEKAQEIQPDIHPSYSQFSAYKDVVASATPERIENIPTRIKIEKRKAEILAKPILVKEIEAVKKVEPKAKVTPQVPKISEEELAQYKEMQTLEIETAKQIEKVELLLRSFRNSRVVEGSEIYDISYEKQQARKLLQNNFFLRQRAESYGTLFTEEMLNKVEPYLLDIANLDISPAPEKVLEIKERVKNQNIIASLQGF